MKMELAAALRAVAQAWALMGTPKTFNKEHQALIIEAMIRLETAADAIEAGRPRLFCAYDPPDPRPSFQDIERALWDPMYRPPTETGWYLLKWAIDTETDDTHPREITDSFFDADLAAAQRMKPELASADPALFGWHDATRATHWRRLPEGPGE